MGCNTSQEQSAAAVENGEANAEILPDDINQIEVIDSSDKSGNGEGGGGGGESGESGGKKATVDKVEVVTAGEKQDSQETNSKTTTTVEKYESPKLTLNLKEAKVETPKITPAPVPVSATIQIPVSNEKISATPTVTVTVEPPKAPTAQPEEDVLVNGHCDDIMELDGSQEEG